MFSFHSFQPGSFRPDRLRVVRRIAFSLFGLLCLSTALLFTGCSTDDGGGGGVGLNSNLIGKWLYTNEFGTDGYTIDAKKVTYISDWYPLAGTIKQIENFTDSAGVIIIQLDAGYGDYGYPQGTFIGIYFKNLNPGVSVQMGTAWAEGGAEEPTLNAAMAAFTLGNEGTYMAAYGTYLWTTD